MAARAAGHDGIGSYSFERWRNGSIPGKTVVAGGSPLASHILEVRCPRCRSQSTDTASNVGTGSYVSEASRTFAYIACDGGKGAGRFACALIITDRCEADPAAISGCCSRVEHRRSE